MAEGCGATCWLAVAATVVVVLVFLRKLFLLITGDADLTLLSKSLVPNFYKNKVVWVTGASSGIGEELCRELSSLGAKVILSARSKDKLLAVKEGLHDPDNARVVVVDMSDKESVVRAAEEATAQFGRIDILFNNAGVTMKSTFMDTDVHVGRKLMDVDFFNLVILTRLVLTGMLKQGGGQIVNTSSIAGKSGYPLRTYYCASKYAVNGLMDSLRFELQEQNIHITNACPGPVKTLVSHSAFTGTGDAYGKEEPMIESGMKADRCAHLMLVAASNHLREVWICKPPMLWMVYASQYFPSAHQFIIAKAGKKIMDEYKKLT